MGLTVEGWYNICPNYRLVAGACVRHGGQLAESIEGQRITHVRLICTHPTTNPLFKLA